MIFDLLTMLEKKPTLLEYWIKELCGTEAKFMFVSKKLLICFSLLLKLKSGAAKRMRNQEEKEGGVKRPFSNFFGSST